MACESPVQESEAVESNKFKELQNVNGNSDKMSVIQNGIGSHKEHKDKHKEKHKHKHRDKDDKHKSKHSSSSSSSKDKHKSEHRDKDRDKSKEHKSSSRDKDKHSSSKDKHSSSHKDKHSSSSKDKERSSSSSKDKHRDKDKEKRDKDRHKDKHKDKHRDGDRKEHKDKHRDKDRHKDKHRDKERSKDKDKHREKDRHRDKSHKDKHRDKDKEKDRHRDKSKEHKEKEIKKEEKSPMKSDFIDTEDFESKPDLYSKQEVKEEPFEMEMKEEPMETEEEDDSRNVSMDDVKEEDEEVEEEEPEMESQDDSMDDDRLVIEEAGSDNEAGDEEYEEPDNEEDEDFEMEEEKPKKKSKSKSDSSKRKRKAMSDDDEDYDFASPAAKKVKKEEKNRRAKKEKEGKKAKVKVEEFSPKKEVESPKKGGRKKKAEETQDVWRWWEEDRGDGKVKWHYLEHKGPIFAPDYEPLPKSVKFYYDGSEMKLSEATEEVAGFYAKMLDHDYTTKEAFNTNFFTDWHKFMTAEEKAKIKRLDKCDFTKMHAYFKMKSEESKNKTKEEKKMLKEKNAELQDEYGFCLLDGHKQKIGNFKIEPPGLFRGRGDHPKMGKVKRRVLPADVIINCSKDSKWPQAPAGHRWKEVRHDNSVTWLASWTENIQGQTKYVMLNANSRLKGEKDWQKYETARRLKNEVDKIRDDYRQDWKSKEMRIRQRSVALYFIDKLALRAGNEKDSDEQADTVGCCSLRFEHIKLYDEKDGQECVVEFDFLGKDSIRYYNLVPVEKRVFKNLRLFMEGKSPGDDLFDRLNTAMMNKYLNELMEGLTAKVFRTYNASSTLQEQLDKLTLPDDTVPAKMLSYNRANRAVAILCNHQRAVPKTHAKSMENLKAKIDERRQQLDDAEADYRSFKRNKDHKNADKAKKKMERTRDMLTKLEVQATDKEENKEIALGTSKLNYLDPRISVAWSKKNEVPIEKVYNKTQRDKFRWAIDMAGPEFVF